MSFEKALSLLGKSLDVLQALPAPGGAPRQVRQVRQAPLAAVAPTPTPKAKAAPKPAAPAAKPAKAPKAKAGSAANSIAAGRQAVASGARPKATDAVATVIGKGTLDAASIVEELAKKKWLPNTGKPQNYVSFILSSNKDIFERVERGKYRVIKGVKLGKAQRVASQSNGSAEASEAVNHASVSSGPAADTHTEETEVDVADVETEETVEVTSKPSESTEAIDTALQELGLGQGQAMANPF